MKPTSTLRKSKFTYKSELLSALIAVVPALVLYLVFTIYPLLLNMVYMLTDWDGMSRDYNFIGLKNFTKVFSDTLFIKAFKNTVYFSIVSIFIGTILQLSLALLLYRNFRGNAIARAVFYLPLVISGVVMAISWRNIFQYTGYMNMILVKFNLISEPIDFFGNSATALNLLIFINALGGLGLGIVLITAGLNAIPQEVNEAAALDGAYGLPKFFKITFPLIMPSLTIIWFIGIVSTLQIFDLPFLMTPNGGPDNSTTTLSMLIYKVLFTRNQFGIGSAMGFVFFLFIATIATIQLWITRKREVEL